VSATPLKIFDSTASLDGKKEYSDADFVVIATVSNVYLIDSVSV